ncbi:LKHA4 [Symbiodinium sp. CCMP2592]|nr:LKHA4 [Symbiodinium sp. CCMP2592]
MPESTGGQTSALSPPHVLEPVTVEKCALTFILDFEAHSLSAHCVLVLVGEEAAPEICLHINECLQILDVHVEGTDLRLDFILDKYLPAGFAALEGSQMMRVLVPPEAWQSGQLYSTRLQVKYRVLPGSTALIWMDGSDDDDAQIAMTQDQPGWASALFPCMDEQAVRSSYLLRLWVPENMMAIAAGGRLEEEPPVRMNGHLEYAYRFDWKMPARSLTFIAGSFGQISGRFSTFFGLTPLGSIQKAAEEIEDSLQPLHDALMHVFKDDDKAGHAGGPVLQVVLLPAHVCPQGGRGVLRLLILPMYMLSAGKAMWYAVELCLVKAWLGVSDCAVSWRDRWLCSGLELYVLQHVMRDAHGDAASMLHLSFLWRGFCRAAQQLPEHGAESRPRCAARAWEKRLGELQELVGGDLAMYLWLGQSLPPEENEALVRRLRRKCREAPISEEVALAALKAHSESPVGLTEWPPDDWCAEQLRKQLRAASSLAEVREVEKVASAWEDIIPVEVVGGLENKLNKLIIRTAIHVKVKWTVLQQLFFLDLLQDSTSIYRESVVHIGNAYGFNASSNADVLRRWCVILIKHNCQDHVGVLETCLELQCEVAHFSSIFAAMVERAQSVTRWKFIAQSLWNSIQPRIHPRVQSHIFRILDIGGCIGCF